MQPSAGDVVVTRVAGHYHVGRVQEDWEPYAKIASISSRVDALDLACRSINGGQRVFLYGRAGTLNFIEFDCAKPRTASS